MGNREGGPVKVGVQIKGGAKLSKQLDLLDPYAREMFRRGLNAAAMQIHSEAKKSISEHRSIGRVYFRGTVAHTASAPGNPPNQDTGNLNNQIKFEVDKETLTARVGTNLMYGKALEDGTSKMKPRPWLRPAYLKVRPFIAKLFKLEVKK
jgi:HK97 gp10 family phage protein